MSAYEGSLLIVEDSAADLRLLQEDLAAAGRPRFRATHVTTLAEAERLLRASRFDAILLDLSLPDCDGLSTVMAIRPLAPESAVVVLSGLEDEELALAAVRAGAQDYRVKGRADGRTLTRAIEFAIARHRAERRRLQLIAELQEAVSRVHILSGMLAEELPSISDRTPRRPLGGEERFVAKAVGLPGA